MFYGFTFFSLYKHVSGQSPAKKTAPTRISVISGGFSSNPFSFHRSYRE